MGQEQSFVFVIPASLNGNGFVFESRSVRNIFSVPIFKRQFFVSLEDGIKEITNEKGTRFKRR